MTLVQTSDGSWEGTSATHFGIVTDINGNIVRIINPQLEEEIDAHHLNPGETMTRLLKQAYEEHFKNNVLTLAGVQAIQQMALS